MSLEDQPSDDPSVAMAKAYCKEKKDDEKKASEDDGPLAFLGLHRKSVDADADVEGGTESGSNDAPAAATAEHRDDEGDQVGVGPFGPSDF